MKHQGVTCPQVLEIQYILNEIAICEVGFRKGLKDCLNLIKLIYYFVPGLVPSHKQSSVLFLERVYGMEDSDLFFRLLEEAFLPDLRAATMLDRVRLNFVSFFS